MDSVFGVDLMTRLYALLLVISCYSVCAEPLPQRLAAPILIKVISLEEMTSSKDNIDLFVAGNKLIAEYLQKRINTSIGQARLNSVSTQFSDDMEPPDVIYVGNVSDSYFSLLSNYAIKHKVMIVSEAPESISKQVAVAIYDNEGIPGILLNLSTSKKLALKWNPDILKVVDVYK